MHPALEVDAELPDIKTGRFAMIYADEVLVSHTNETEYVNFVNNKRAEALHDRIIVQRLEEGEQVVGGIIIPDTAKEKPQ